MIWAGLSHRLMAEETDMSTEQERKQMMANGVWRGLKAQGWKQSKVGGVCATRGDFDARMDRERCCAIGWLITDEAMSNRYDKFSTHRDLWTDLLHPVTTEMMQFGGALQRAHDNADFVEGVLVRKGTAGRMRENLREVIEQYGCVVPDEIDMSQEDDLTVVLFRMRLTCHKKTI